MKIYDFDAKFFEYARSWMALHPGLREDQIEAKYNEMMMSWLNAPAQWLDGAKPGEYFERYSEPKDLLKLIEEYHKRGYGLPEPLYSRVVKVGAACLPGLVRIASDWDRPEPLRATALALIRDIDPASARELLVALVASSREPNELAELAADALREAEPSAEAELFGRFDGASDYARELILDICARPGAGPEALPRLTERLLTCTGKRDHYAALLERMGDPAAIEPLKQALRLTELDYLEYIAIRNAIESLGGDPGEERDFNGDPSYEALRNM